MQDEDRVPPKRMRASDADRDAVAERLAIALTEAVSIWTNTTTGSPGR